MNLRKKSLVQYYNIDEVKLEALFKKENVAIRYDKVMGEEKVKIELSVFFSKIEEAVEEIIEEIGGDDEIREMTSPTFLSEYVKQNVQANVVGRATEKIVFDGVPTEKAVIDIITVDFMVEILQAMRERLIEDIQKIALEKMLGKVMKKLLQED